MEQVVWTAELRRLEKLSTVALARSLAGAVADERHRSVFVVAHLAEVLRRKAHLELGYPNLFDYCVDHLGLGPGTVASRLQVAGVARRFPQVLEALFDGRISLTVAGLLAAKLTPGNFSELLLRSTGKTKREVEELLVKYAPKREVSSGVSRQRRRTPRSGSRSSADGAETSRASACATPASPSARGRLEPAQPDVFNFRFAASGDFKSKLERFAEVLGVEDPRKNLAELFERALESALHQRDPRERAERRAQRAEKRTAEASEPPARPDKERAPRSRHIRAAVRDQALERAAHRCEYHGPDGKRCDARAALEIDHRYPFARGGTSSPANLRVLCRAHNLFAAEKTFGERFIREKIRTRQLQT